MFKLTENQNYHYNVIDKIFLYPKDVYEAKYQVLINEREKVGLDNCNDPITAIEHSNDMQVCKMFIKEEYNSGKSYKVLIVFDDIISYMFTNRKLNSIVTELFIRGRGLKILLVFITQSYFRVPKDIGLIPALYVIMKISGKRELQQIAINYSSDIDLKIFWKFTKNVLQNRTLL